MLFNAVFERLSPYGNHRPERNGRVYRACVRCALNPKTILCTALMRCYERNRKLNLTAQQQAVRAQGSNIPSVCVLRCYEGCDEHLSRVVVPQERCLLSRLKSSLIPYFNTRSEDDDDDDDDDDDVESWILCGLSTLASIVDDVVSCSVSRYKRPTAAGTHKGVCSLSLPHTPLENDIRMG